MVAAVIFRHHGMHTCAMSGIRAHICVSVDPEGLVELMQCAHVDSSALDLHPLMYPPNTYLRGDLQLPGVRVSDDTHQQPNAPFDPRRSA